MVSSLLKPLLHLPQRPPLRAASSTQLQPRTVTGINRTTTAATHRVYAQIVPPRRVTPPSSLLVSVACFCQVCAMIRWFGIPQRDATMASQPADVQRAVKHDHSWRCMLLRLLVRLDGALHHRVRNQDCCAFLASDFLLLLSFSSGCLEFCVATTEVLVVRGCNAKTVVGKSWLSGRPEQEHLPVRSTSHRESSNREP